MRISTGLVVGLVCGLIGSLAQAAEQGPRTLSFEDRVNAQRAIERVYYGHQLGATKPFDEAVRTSVLEAKVHKYLDQSAALDSYWHTAVDDKTLQRELTRMAGGTRMPERLLELYAALGNDPFLIKECLARPALVDRLTHNFYAFDPTLHAKAKAQAESIRSQLASGALSPTAEHPSRTVSEIVVGETPVGPARAEKPLQQRLTPAEFQKQRAELPKRAGQVSDIRESREAFLFDVILTETATSLRVAHYVVQKSTWDAWWEAARRTLRGDAVMPVASGIVDLPVPPQSASTGHALTCAPYDTWDSAMLTDVPEPRSGNTTIWTGELMIVWGGSGSFGDLNTGARYDPATDAWTATSTVGAPTARYGHSAVWSGSVMIVWGGGDGLDSGGRYDPLTDTWTPTSTQEAPAGRTDHAAVWTGGVMIVWGGGRRYPSDSFNTGGQYDPATDTWTATSTEGAPSPASEPEAFWTGSEMIVWNGGAAWSGRYDPASDTWATMSTAGEPSWRYWPSVIWTGSEMIVWGGTDFSSEADAGGRYNPTTDTWTSTSTVGAPHGRHGHSAIWTGSSMVVWGGRYGDHDFLRDGGRYEPNSDTWTPISSVGAPSPRERHSAIWTGSAMVVWGGDRYGELNTGGRYALDSDTWTPTSTGGAPDARVAHTAVWTGNLFVVWGGYNANLGEIGTGGRYDPALDTWTQTTTIGAPTARDTHTAVWTGSEMIVWGGFADGPDYPTAGGRYDPVTDHWLETSTVGAPDGRYGHTAVWTGQRMIVWGGFQYPIGPVNTGGRYDPMTDSWTPVSLDGAPTSRDYHTAVWTGTRMVVWGGRFTGNTGGRYDPETDTWAATSVVGAPSPRDSHTAVWTGSQMIIWGGGGNSVLNTGGRYDPTADTWAYTSTNFPPSPRYGHTAIWTGNEMIVWGGFGGSYGSYANTGGRYNPVSNRWMGTSTVGAPAGREGQSAVWTGSAMLVWGGSNSSYVDTGGRYVADTSPDLDGDGYTQCGGDCDDGNATIHPNALDPCDGVDNNCDGSVDNGYLICDDYNRCTDDICTGIGGCSHANNTRSCNDNNICTSGDACRDGHCVGTVTDGIACEDGNYCTTNDVCTGGVCTGAARTCDDQNVCTTDSCDWYYGCINSENSNPCEDGNSCTLGDMCAARVCVPGPAVPCDDHNDCTDDTCDAVTHACSFTSDDTNACSDGNLCTQTDTCGGGICVGSNPIECHAGCPPGSTDLGTFCQKTYDIDASNLIGVWWWCDSLGYDRYTTDASSLYGFRWTDGGASPATVLQVDVELGVGRNCSGGIRGLYLNDARGAAATFYPGYSCQCPSSGQLVAVPEIDTSAYVLGGSNTILIRNQSGSYGEGLSRNPLFGGSFPFARVTVTYLPNGNTCQVASCAPETGVCGSAALPDGTACAGNACTGEGFCEGGFCQGTAPPDCNDGNACTDDSCDAEEGCVHTDNSNTCDDGNPCSDDTCDPESGCAHSNNTAACNDDNACTTEDTCNGGACLGNTVLCTDDNPCTTDHCDSATGCVFTNNTDSCDDGNPCTTDDTCGRPIHAGFSRESFDAVTAPALPQGWASGVIGWGSPWVTRTSGSDTPPNSVFGIDSDHPADEVLESPAIAIATADATLTFRNRWRFEDEWSCYDAAVLDIAIGYGPFEDIQAAGGTFISGGYNDWVDPYSGNPLDYRAAWCHTSENYPDYLTTSVKLPPSAAGQTIRLRWRIGSDSASAFIGQDIDSIEIIDGANTCNGGPAPDCNDNNPCTNDSCDPATGCVHLANTNTCDDGSVCTTNDTCAGGACIGAAIDCNDNNLCTTETCNPATGCVFTNNANPCDDGDACTADDACVGGACLSGTPLACDDGNACTSDTCNPATGCVFTNNTSPCDDRNACTTGDICGGGACRGGASLTCTDGNGCTTDTCNPATGCVFTNNTNPCDDGNACTRIDVCSAGTCVGGNPVVCGSLDQCHDAGACNPSTGTCANPAKPNGTICDDASLCTTGETCQSGTCTPAYSGLNHPAPKSAGYYKKLCQQREHNPSHYQGDELTESDAVCVGQLTTTFAGMATIDQLCEVVNSDHRPPHGGRHHGGSGDGGNGKDCDKGEDELIATALNICRARVCEEQNLDSSCHGNAHTTVSQSFVDADAILDDVSRTKDTCKDARCELREINNGHALEMNSLALARESNKVRLTWSSNELDDGSGTASAYDVWRRPMGSSDAFVKIGTTSGLTYLDATAGTAAWEYDITAVIPGN